MKRRRRVDFLRAAGRAGCSSVVFDSTNRSLECGGATIVDAVESEVDTAPRMAPKRSASARSARCLKGFLRGASALSLCSDRSESESDIRIGESLRSHIGLRLTSRRVIADL